MYSKAQNTIDTLIVLTVLILAAIIFAGYVFGLFSSSQKSIENTNIYDISSISFLPKTPIAPIGSDYYGEFTINIYSSSIPSFDNLFIVQKVSNSSIISSSTCPQYIMFVGFPQKSIICTNLSSNETVLPEGNSEYILTYGGSLYNITAYNQANDSTGYADYVVFNQNGKISFEQLLPSIPILIQ